MKSINTSLVRAQIEKLKAAAKEVTPQATPTSERSEATDAKVGSTSWFSMPNMPKSFSMSSSFKSKGMSGIRLFGNNEANNEDKEPRIRVMLLVQDCPSKGEDALKRDFLLSQKEMLEQQFEGEKRVWEQKLQESIREVNNLKSELDTFKTKHARAQEKFTLESARAEAEAQQTLELREKHKTLLTICGEVEAEANEYVMDFEECEANFSRQSQEFEEYKEIVELERVAWHDARRAAAAQIETLQITANVGQITANDKQITAAHVSTTHNNGKIQGNQNGMPERKLSAVETTQNYKALNDAAVANAHVQAVRSELVCERRRADGLDLEIKILKEKLKELGEVIDPVKVVPARGSKIRSMQELIANKTW
mmetsp:Transcript_17799/g.29926  ORF Transcript_17799/g.29926 Transcript_17799/m.29926 type:complete len:368 (-) Transcript_17799:101-1204(-)